MKGCEDKLLYYMEGAKKRFVIPVYQRNYDWKTENCKQLYDDLIKVAKTGRKSHFFGSIVSSYQPNGRYTEFLVIDGQQRLTTVSLLMLAMYNLIKEGKAIPETETMASELFEDYLVDKHQPKETRIKLKPVKNDRRAFEKLFDLENEKDNRSNLTCNYEYFYNRIQKEEISIEQLYNALFTLEIINIQLTSDDNPQLIFESLNSTGLDLSEGDKIRNFILMGLSPDKQEDYYEKYWNNIEIETKYNVSMFIRDYLSVKQQSIPSISKVYVSFKNYVEERAIETKELLEDLLKYAKRYKILLCGRTNDSELNACIYRLNRLETTITRPFFLEVLRLWDEGKGLVIDEVREIFLYTENYIFRRTICDLPTNSLNKIFLFLNREITRYDGTHNDYVAKFKYALISKTERGRYPDDEEFINALSNRQIYLMNSKNKIYIFERLENFGTKETKDIFKHCDNGDYSIEHIMPQTLSKEWKKDLGEDYELIHEQWLHRLANLTLTAYNSKYSNNEFLIKRDIENGFNDSGLRMNTWIAKQDKWTEDELEERDNILMSKALQIWQRPTTEYAPPEKPFDSATLEDDVDLRGRRISKFSYKNNEYLVTGWMEMMEKILLILHEENSSVLTLLANTYDDNNELTSYVSNKPEGLRSVAELEPGIYLERNTNTPMKISMLRKFFKAYNVNPEDLVFYMREDEEEGSKEENAAQELRRKYWAYALEFIHKAHETDGSFSNVHPSKTNWISGFFGVGGFNISCVANYDAARIDMYLGKSNKDQNKDAFDFLFKHKEEIENALKEKLTWERLDDKKASVICIKKENVSIENEADWKQMAEFHADWSKKFVDVFVPLLIEWNEKVKK